MSKDNKIEIVFAPNISNELMQDFNSYSVDINASRSQFEGENFEHFDAEAFSGIFIYITTHQTEIFVNNLLFPALIHKLLTFYDRIKTKTKPDLEINFKDSELGIEFKIQGSADNQTMQKAISELSDVCTKKMYAQYLNKKEFITREGSKPKIRMTYNPETNKYEPTNFRELRNFLLNQLKNTENLDG